MWSNTFRIEGNLITDRLNRLEIDFLRYVLKKDFDLTPMQINVVFLTAQGASIGDAIDLLSVSASTFNHHLNKALFKMSCKHRYELTAKFWSLVSLIESKKIWDIVASKHFEIPMEQVTEEHRDLAKQLYYMFLWAEIEERR